ncbi:MAG: DUF1176 domain-containing protein [Anaerolineae bacterium]|nr:DUF1176 domain-containing protein [Anaerolineae bacterium]
MFTSTQLRRISFLVLIALCFLACKTLTGGLESPTPSPGLPPTRTQAPAVSPTPKPTFTASPKPTATALPSPTITALPSPTSVLGVDLHAESVSYVQRPLWRAILGWPDECETGFSFREPAPEDYGGVDIYPLDDERYLIFVTCTVGPYWYEWRAYLLNAGRGSIEANPLTVPVWSDLSEELQNIDVLSGLPAYDPETQMLTNLSPARGLKDCGISHKYRFDKDHFVLVEARSRECDDTTTDPLGEWPLVYPPQPPEYLGPFRKVAPVDAELAGGQLRKFEAFPEGDLCLTTNAGYATFRDGAWDTHVVSPREGFVGVDTEERVWGFPSPGTIGYRIGDGQFVLADDGWQPVEDWTIVRRNGIIPAAAGQVWVTAETDVRAFDGEKWTVYNSEALEMPPMSEEDFGMDFTLTYAENLQQVWVGRCDWGGPGPGGGGGARWFDGQVWRGSQTQVAGGCVTAIAAGAEGHVWIGMDHGVVWLFDQTGGDWQQYDLPEPGEPMHKGYPIGLVLDPSGAPWLLSGLCGGASCDARRALYHFRDGVWVEVAGLDIYSRGELYNHPQPPLLFDGAGTPWFFFDGKAFRIEDDRLVEPPAVLDVWAGVTDASGQLWLIAQGPDENAPALWVLDLD